MTASRRPLPFLITGIVVLTAAVLCWLSGRSASVATRSTVTAVPVSVPTAVAAPSSPAPASIVPVSVAPPQEIAATARMYAAHAPLRAPEVADPDSTANRQVLQTMVTKALARAGTAAPVVAARKP